MRLTGLLSARESLITHGQAIAQISDNLANANTTGFKAVRTEFEDLFAEGSGGLFGAPIPVGNGSAVDKERILQDKQGSLDFTDRSLDVAIDGGGFFQTTNGTDTFYTRAGIFTVNSDGEIVTAEGDQLMGFTETSPTAPVALSVAGSTLSAQATSTVTIRGNANTTAPLLAGGVPAATDFAALADAADFTTPIQVIDSLGATHDVSLYFFHTAALGYTIQAYVDGSETGGTAGAPVQVGTGTVAFDGVGAQAAGAAATMTINAAWGNGANAQATTVDLSGLTGFAAPSNLSGLESDGSAAGSISGYEIEKNGTLNVLFSTGGKISAGTIALSTFRNAGELQRVGSTKLAESSASGKPTVGRPQSDGRGSTVGGALENSTVDPTGEFVDMIRFQRAYQAGSQVIQTYSQLLNTTIQIS